MRKWEGKYGVGRLMALAVLGLMLGSIGFASGEIRIVPVSHRILEDGTDDGTPPYKDKNRSIEERVEDLLSRMTLEEKIEQMHGEISEEMQQTGIPMRTADNERLGIPGFRFTDGPRGPRWGYTTTFPVAIARGATWDPEIEYRVGVVMGNETRALGRNCLLAPCINLVRDPRGGRSQETYGEDTWHVGKMSIYFIEGVQSQKAMACAKHYACNNDENQRFMKNSIVDPRTLNEIYLPHFRRAVQDANVASIMTAYNRINGEYGCANFDLVRQKLKGEWGFNGFVVSDWVATSPYFMTALGLVAGLAGMAIGTGVPVPNENFTGAPYFPTTETCLRAGLDVEMPFSYVYEPQVLYVLVTTGALPIELINDAVRRILRMKFAYGLFDDDPAQFDPKVVESQEHIMVTRFVEQEGAVLLKNDASTLPFNLANIKSIAVIGPAADDKDRLGDHGSSNAQPTPEKIVTVLAGIKNKVGGSATVSYMDGSDINAAAALAKTCDATIVVVGRNYTEESEGKDLETLALSGNQPELIKAVGDANKNCVVVIIAGSAVTMNEWIDKVPAILMAWYPGMEGGNAIADIIFGDINPSGKLPITFPRSEDQLPPFNSNELDDVYSYYHGYRYFDKFGIEPQFPFGYGLSYTTFEFSNLKLDKKIIGLDGKVQVSVDVKNTGERAGAEVVQIYIGYNGSAVDRAVKDLKGFNKVFLQPGEKKTVTIEIDAKNLSYYSAGLGKFVVEEIEYLVYVGSSSRDIRLTDSFAISSLPPQPAEEVGKRAFIPGFESIFVLLGVIVIFLHCKAHKD